MFVIPAGATLKKRHARHLAYVEINKHKAHKEKHKEHKEHKEEHKEHKENHLEEHEEHKENRQVTKRYSRKKTFVA